MTLVESPTATQGGTGIGTAELSKHGSRDSVGVSYTTHTQGGGMTRARADKWYASFSEIVVCLSGGGPTTGRKLCKYVLRRHTFPRFRAMEPACCRQTPSRVFREGPAVHPTAGCHLSRYCVPARGHQRTHWTGPGLSMGPRSFKTHTLLLPLCLR